MIVKETVAEKSYRWELDGAKVEVIVRQPPGVEQEVSAEIVVALDSAAPLRLSYGETYCCGHTVAGPAACRHSVAIRGLKPRGAQYYLRIEAGDWTSPLLSFRTLFRYPYGYVFGPHCPELRHRPGSPRIVPAGSSVDIRPVLEQLAGTDPRCYLRHIIHTIVEPSGPPMEKLKAIVEFLGNAVHHNPLLLYTGSQEALDKIARDGWEKADIDLDAAIILELHCTSCGYMNGVLLPALARLVGIRVEGYALSGSHTSARALLDGTWYFVDADTYKKGNHPTMPDGSLPTIEWLSQPPNYYLLDTRPAHAEIGWKGGWHHTQDGFLCTGFKNGQNPSELGFASSLFGAPVEFPPSLPIPLPVRRHAGLEVQFEWVGSYDRDGNLRDYVLSVGTQPGAYNIAVATTTECAVKLELPRPGYYYWRVRARDSHALASEFEDQIYYEPSEERKLDTASLPEEPNGWCLPEKATAGDGSDRFQPANLPWRRIEGEDDLIGDGARVRTEIFPVQWGTAGKVLQLVDPTNRWISGAPARSLWQLPLPHSPAVFSLDLLLLTGRSFMAGDAAFPVLYVLDAEDERLGCGLHADPDRGVLQLGIRSLGTWYGLGAIDPGNRWRSYRIEATVKPTSRPQPSRADAPEGRCRPYAFEVALFCDGALVARWEPPQPVSPRALYLSSNPTGELTLWLAEIALVAPQAGELGADSHLDLLRGLRAQ